MKVQIKYFRLKVTGDKAEAEFEFNHSGHCERVLRGLVHSGYEVIIREVSETKEVTEVELRELAYEGANYSVIDDPKSYDSSAYQGTICQLDSAIAPLTSRGRI